MPPTPEEHFAEVARRAETYSRGLKLTPEEYEAIMDETSALTDLHYADTTYFVLGSYGEDAKRRLTTVRNHLDGRANARAVLMDDVTNELQNSYAKFRLIADLVDYIVGVAEHRCGGFLVEQGYFTAIDEYFRRTYVLKLAYPNDDIRESDHDRPFSWMQSGVFDMLSREGRVYVWHDEPGLEACVGKLPS